MDKLGICIPTYNRKKYLEKTLECLKNTIFNTPVEIILVDDGSNKKIKLLLMNSNYVIYFKHENKGVADSLKYGLSYLKEKGCTIFCTLDSDAIMTPDWINKEFVLLEKYPDHIITGFNSSNPKHTILETGENYYKKHTANGINYMFNESNYDNVMEALKYNNAWDQHLCTLMARQKKPFICTKPSVIQHIGVESSKTLKHDYIEIAKDFLKIEERYNMQIFIMTSDDKTTVYLYEERQGKKSYFKYDDENKKLIRCKNNEPFMVVDNYDFSNIASAIKNFKQ